jgi:hypothetical protein
MTPLRPVAAPPTRPATPAPTAPRREYRERDFGVGYGRSSGYASARHYAQAWNGQPRFRCG